nr:EAL domain-containing protein [Metabacillus iocasae]
MSNQETFYLCTIINLTEERNIHTILKRQRHIHQLIAQNTSLSEILNEIALTVESLHPDLICSILLLDNSTGKLSYGAAPNLPDEYINSLNDIEIGPSVGSCGTAAFQKEEIFVGNIKESPLWEGLNNFALKHGLQSCWSTPIFSSTNHVVGTFAIYYRTIQDFPSYEQRKTVDAFSHLAGVAIENKQTKKELMEREKWFHSLFYNNIDPVYSLNLEGEFVEVNEATVQVSGYSRHELIGHSFIPYIHPEDLSISLEAFERSKQGKPQTIEIRIFHQSKSIIYLTVTTTPVVMDGNVTNIFVIGKDMTAQKAYETTIHEMAYHDPLTNLPNRRLFEKKVNEAMTTHQELAVLYIDLDRFKYVNDTFGHEVGDDLLLTISHLLQTNVNKDALVARLGGDEFTILLPSIHEKECAIQLAEHILSLLQQSFFIRGHYVHVTPSIGVAFYPNDGINSHLLMKHADIAMYEAKKKGRNRCCVYEPHMNESAVTSYELEGALRRAIQFNELSLVYQPIIHMQSKKLTAVEALVRWNHSTLGPIPPDQFITIAEENGFIHPLGYWVLETAFHQFSVWQQRAQAPPRIAINISVRQLQNSHFAQDVIQLLQKYNLSASSVELEVTESTIMKNEKIVVENLSQLKEIGVSISIDDFGTGYSSLSYLKRFSVNKLKIDRSFVSDLPQHGFSSTITSALISLAQQLNIEVVAEGVETDEQFEFLKSLHCEEAQGYLFSHPLPGEELMKKEFFNP